MAFFFFWRINPTVGGELVGWLVGGGWGGREDGRTGREASLFGERKKKQVWCETVSVAFGWME